jgi:hypothetical protein
MGTAARGSAAPTSSSPLHAGDAEPDVVPPFLAPTAAPAGLIQLHFGFETSQAETTYQVDDVIDVWVVIDGGSISPDALQFVVRYDPGLLEAGNDRAGSPHCRRESFCSWQSQTRDGSSMLRTG